MLSEETNRARLKTEQDYLDNLFGTAFEPAGQNAVEPVNDGLANVDMSLPFDCQLIVVAGLKLALPVAAISRVLTDATAIETSASTNDLLAGRVYSDGHAIDVIDLASVVLAGKKPAAATNNACIILLRDGFTGLLCDRLLERLGVIPDRLCRREQHSRRIWLAATARSDGYAVLDVAGIRQMLDQAAHDNGKHHADGEQS